MYRDNQNSISYKHSKDAIENLVSMNCRVILEGILCLDDFLQNIEFFQKNTEYKYIIFESIMKSAASRILPIYMKISSYELDEIFCKEFEKYRNHSRIFAFLFNRMNILHINLNQSHQIIHQLRSQNQQ